MSEWIASNGISELLNKTKFEICAKALSDLKIEFVIVGRNFSHFLDREEDKRATWCSWYKLVKSIAEKPVFSENLKLLINHLKNSSVQNIVLSELTNLELQLRKYRFVISINN